MSNSAIVFGQTDVSLQGAVGFKNRIINGDFRIHQRSGTISTGVGALTYTLDRWIVAAGTAALSVSQGSESSAPYNYLLISGAASNANWSIRQRIESRNIRDLAGKQVTLSFYLYNSTGNASNASVVVSSANAADNFSAMTIVSSQSVNLSGAGLKQTFTLTLNAACANGIEIRFESPSPFTSGFLVLHTVQLESGTISTPFENRPIGVELSLCQRYYQAAIGGGGSFLRSYNYSASSALVPINMSFKATMRANPVVSGTYDINDGTAQNLPAVNSNPDGFQVGSISVPAGQFIDLQSYTASAEL